MTKELSGGDVFAGYRIEALIGRGGMGIVYLAEHLMLQRKVALKLLAPEMAIDDGFRQRFIRESRAAASLDHPNVIPIHEAGEVDGLLYLSMRYVKGSDLKGLLERDGALSLERTVDLLRQAASALDAAHAEELVHRDVKPQNMMVARDSSLNSEHVYLTDFGLTKHLESKTHLTATGTFMGSLDYCSPEQIEGKDLDGRADVYSLGCVLYECLSGRIPFDKGTGPSVIYAHMSEPPPVLSEARPGLPAELDDIIAKAMAKDPEQRYISSGELVEAVAATLEGAPPGATVAASTGPGPGTVVSKPAAPRTVASRPAPAAAVPAPPGAPVASKRLPSRPLLIAGGAVALLVLVLLGVMLLGGGTDATLTGEEFPARQMGDPFPKDVAEIIPKTLQGSPLSAKPTELSCTVLTGASGQYFDNRGSIYLEVCPFGAVEQADAQLKTDAEGIRSSGYEQVESGTIELPDGETG